MKIQYYLIPLGAFSLLIVLLLQYMHGKVPTRDAVYMDQVVSNAAPVTLPRIQEYGPGFQHQPEKLDIVTTVPLSQYPFHGVSDSLVFYFTYPVDLEEFQQFFEIYPSNDKEGSAEVRDGFFNGNFYYLPDGQGNIDERIIMAEPTFDFRIDTEYEAIIRAGLPSLNGEKQLHEDVSVSFFVAEKQ